MNLFTIVTVVNKILDLLEISRDISVYVIIGSRAYLDMKSLIG